MTRLADVALMSKYFIELYALSGVVLRANHFRKDLRLVGYSYYSRIEFNVVVGIKGDSMDRYLVRMNESLESVKTLNKCIRTLTTWYLSYTEVYGHVLSTDHYVADLIATLGTADIVLGSVDKMIGSIVRNILHDNLTTRCLTYDGYKVYGVIHKHIYRSKLQNSSSVTAEVPPLNYRASKR